jgi:hypothetical protein
MADDTIINSVRSQQYTHTITLQITSVSINLWLQNKTLKLCKVLSNPAVMSWCTKKIIKLFVTKFVQNHVSFPSLHTLRL